MLGGLTILVANFWFIIFIGFWLQISYSAYVPKVMKIG